MLGLMYDETILSRQLDDGEEMWIAEYQGKSAGYLCAAPSDDGSIFLSKFYVDVDLHGKGIGRALFETLLHAHPESQIIALNVNRLNFAAVNAYFRFGFVIEGVQDTDFGSGYTMADFRMVWKRREQKR